ncbi:hypothetical protein [Microvirga sp. Mcv34]|uniref:hypothetical protein n=1 Tax=Microvirga sp. Mcv34 TaxID=2926016 RepID=UPI0021C9D830|nr:hypothetical protein [Microvirga sp. Mcv34]
MTDTTAIERGKNVRERIRAEFEKDDRWEMTIYPTDLASLLAYIESLEARQIPESLVALAQEATSGPLEVSESASSFGVYTRAFRNGKRRLVATFAKPHDDAFPNARLVAATFNLFSGPVGRPEEAPKSPFVEAVLRDSAIAKLVEICDAVTLDIGRTSAAEAREFRQAVDAVRKEIKGKAPEPVQAEETPERKAILLLAAAVRQIITNYPGAKAKTLPIVEEVEAILDGKGKP